MSDRRPTEVVVVKLLPAEAAMLRDFAAGRDLSESDLIRESLGLLPEAQARTRSPRERVRRLSVVRPEPAA